MDFILEINKYNIMIKIVHIYLVNVIIQEKK